MSRLDRDAIGQRGEWLFALHVSKFHGHEPLFRPAFLGEKWPTADHAIEIVSSPGMFFLVQVKSTRAGIARNERIKIKAKTTSVQRLLDAPVPAFLVAVDERKEQSFIVRPRTAKVSSVCSAFPLLDPEVRIALRKEVVTFWESAAMKQPYESIFLDYV